MPMIELHKLRNDLPLNTNSVMVNESSTSTSTTSSRWNTKEFYLYYVVIALVVPYMFYITYGLSKMDHPNYHLYSHLLSEGWIFNRKVDNSDLQYAQFRNHLPLLFVLAFFYLLLSRLYHHVLIKKQKRQTNSDSSVRLKASFHVLTSLIILTALHGTSLIKIWIIITTSYLLGRLGHDTKWNPFLTWLFNLLILFLNEYFGGYSFKSMIASPFMDQYQGLLPRWHVFFNFTILRLISYNMDYYWKHNNLNKHHDPYEEEPTDKDRIQIPCVLQDYNYLNFLSYILYLPLYLCGPIITFNDFISQLRFPSSKVTPRFIFTYALRLAFVILLMELTLHYLYVVAISKAQAWNEAHNSPLELCMIGYFNLVIIWMKLLIPWRFFRLWALGDGIYTEENMIRCVSNNFSGQRFWKSWHRSFNRWTIRYIYLPLGGSHYITLNIWIVFTFVALWHDIELKLLAWGWLICLFLLPEIIGTRLFTYKKFGSTFYYRFVCGIGAVCNIGMMMIANLVGFCLGVDGMKTMLKQIFNNSMDGFVFLISVIFCLYTAVQIMFEIRESEKRRGDPKWLM
ncbi:MBOAT, membrane-bound O-acyltransferase family-domain-containing protein [Cokeromyces recurvatus]|uniref:MBOAT, membrane-bound O-acyltransferase family-domain-containing protein n=1 Tax=Cokeromyces recurvatus TaxID=90255 RepID=UPI00221FF632|nr:MBOAT, membrane-bound O-acyltransferase family-domain-containing protein [Cokeromyces recurvatus]KAI7903660.1 MBOAT, membrane-bound O-acyltransferase family-domain-containing protein [Cokeromyces recurvatus]